MNDDHKVTILDPGKTTLMYTSEYVESLRATNARLRALLEKLRQPLTVEECYEINEALSSDDSSDLEAIRDVIAFTHPNRCNLKNCKEGCHKPRERALAALRERFGDSK